MNGFEMHGIQHTSPSSLNMFATAPCAWVAKYLFGHKFKFSLAARAGVLAEDAVVNILANGWTQDKATEEAIKSYNKSCAFGASDADLKRGDAITGMIENAVTELKGYGQPEFTYQLIGTGKQKKIELLCKGDGWQLPVIGFLDLDYPKHGLTVDLKTTMRLPTIMSDEHMRQGAIYKAAKGNHAVKFLYVSGKSFKWHDIENHLPILAEVKVLLNRQEKFLASGDRDLLKSIVPVNASSYYWSDDSELRKSIYGI